MKNAIRGIGLVVFACSLAVAFAPVARADSLATFSVTSGKTQYKVGEEFTVSFSVDAGSYSSTLSAIDFTIKLSDTSVIEPTNKSNPYVAGNIFSQIALQSFSGNLINVVTYINPASKPANRSGQLGTIAFRALKAGNVTISYDKIEAVEEGEESNFASTRAASLALAVAAEDTAAAVTADTSGDTAEVTATTRTTAATTTKAKTVAASATTGPAAVAVVLIIGSATGYALYRGMRQAKRKRML